MPRRSPRFATVDAPVGDMEAIPDGPFAGESLTLQANGHFWHFEFQIHLFARRLLMRIQQSRAAQGSDDYDESDANEEDEEDHSWEHGESGCAALNVMLDGIHVLGLPYHMLRL